MKSFFLFSRAFSLSFFLLSFIVLLAHEPLLHAKTLRFGEFLCQDPKNSCREIGEGEKWDTLWPDPKERDLLRRFNRVNIRLRKGMKIAVPPNLGSLKRNDISPFPQQIKPTGEKQLVVDLNQLAWAAYDLEGHLLEWGPASGGKSFCPDVGYACRSPVGDFRVFQKGGPRCKSGKFPIPKGGAPMPYCMYFKPGYALHGSYEVPGYNASHGCARLYPEDAKWLNENFVESPKKVNSFQGTKIIVYPYTDREEIKASKKSAPESIPLK